MSKELNKDTLEQIILQIKKARKEIRHKLLFPFTLIYNEAEIYIDELVLYAPDPCHSKFSLEDAKNTYNVWEYVLKTATFVKVKKFIETVDKTDNIAINIISHTESMLNAMQQSLAKDQIIFNYAVWKLMNENGLIRTKDDFAIKEDFMVQTKKGYSLSTEDFEIMIKLITTQFFFYRHELVEGYAQLKQEELNQNT
jgi:hypothetical protein